MSTTPNGGFVANSISFESQNGTSQGEKITSAYNGNSYGSLYYIVDNRPTTPYVEYDPYSPVVQYAYPEKVDNEYVVKVVNNGVLYQEDGLSVNDLATAISEQYSSVADTLKEDPFGLSSCTSFSEAYEELKLQFLEDYGFSENVVDAGVNYTLGRNGGVYTFVFSGDCAEYIDGTWYRLKMSATVKFSGTMVYKSSFEQLEQTGTSPSDIIDEYWVAEDYAIETYSTKYKPDISDIAKLDEYNEILKSAYAKMNADNGFVLKMYMTYWDPENPLDSGAFGNVYAYDGTNKESSYWVSKNLDVVDYTDWSKGDLGSYNAFGYENGTLYYDNSINKSIATDSNKEKVTNDQIKEFNSAIESIGGYIGETGLDTVGNLCDLLYESGASSADTEGVSFTKNGDTYKISVTATVGEVNYECAIEFTENGITRWYVKGEYNYPDKENGSWLYNGYDLEAYSTTYKPI